MAKYSIKSLLCFSLLIFSLTNCKKDGSQQTAIDPYYSAKKEFLQFYANTAYQLYVGAYMAAIEFQNKVTAFIANPTEAGFSDLKLYYAGDFRFYYDHSEIFRFVNGPIDGPNGPEKLLNAWPCDEAYIDYTQTSATAPIKYSGIICDSIKYPRINENLLDSLNSLNGETNISVGYHAIEFLLWGQDFYADSPGKRSYKDYLNAGTTVNYGYRRGQYLVALSKLIVKHLGDVRQAWMPNQSNYRADFLNASVEESFKTALTGIGRYIKGELYGDRTRTSYKSQDQEDETSCFSDQTDQDLKWGQGSVYSIFNGSFETASGSPISKGTSLLSVLKIAKDTSAIASQIRLSSNSMNLIQHPFDQEIIKSDGRLRVQNAITNGSLQADLLVEYAAKMGISLSL